MLCSMLVEISCQTLHVSHVLCRIFISAWKLVLFAGTTTEDEGQIPHQRADDCVQSNETLIDQRGPLQSKQDSRAVVLDLTLRFRMEHEDSVELTGFSVQRTTSSDESCGQPHITSLILPSSTLFSCLPLNLSHLPPLYRIAAPCRGT